MSLLKLAFEPEPALLLQPPLPKPLWGISPRVLMGDKLWQVEKQKARASTGGKCAACGIEPDRLDAHEVYCYNRRLYRQRLQRIVPLCWMCHQYIHISKSLQMGIISFEKATDVYDHGEKLLDAHPGLKEVVDAMAEIAYFIVSNEFSQRWHLRWQHKSHYGLNQQQWEKWYGKQQNAA